MGSGDEGENNNLPIMVYLENAESKFI
jgi:hypothetical protein